MAADAVRLAREIQAVAEVAPGPDTPYLHRRLERCRILAADLEVRIERLGAVPGPAPEGSSPSGLNLEGIVAVAHGAVLGAVAASLAPYLGSLPAPALVPFSAMTELVGRAVVAVVWSGDGDPDLLPVWCVEISERMCMEAGVSGAVPLHRTIIDERRGEDLGARGLDVAGIARIASSDGPEAVLGAVGASLAEYLGSLPAPPLVPFSAMTELVGRVVVDAVLNGGGNKDLLPVWCAEIALLTVSVGAANQAIDDLVAASRMTH